MVACSPVAVAGCGLAVRVEGVSKLVVGAVGETGRIGSGVAGVVLPVPGVFGFHMRVWCSFRGKSWGRDGLAEGSRRLNVHYTQSYAPMFAGKAFPCGNLFAFWAEPRRVRRRGVRLGLQLRRRVGAAIPKKWSRRRYGGGAGILPGYAISCVAALFCLACGFGLDAWSGVCRCGCDG